MTSVVFFVLGFSSGAYLSWRYWAAVVKDAEQIRDEADRLLAEAKRIAAKVKAKL